MAKVLTKQTQATVVEAVLTDPRPRPRPTFPHHSPGSEEMMRSIVVMVVEAVVKLDIPIPDPGRQGPLEVSVPAGLVKEWYEWITKDSDANICVRNCEGIFVAFGISSKRNSCFIYISEQGDYD
jgi:hypothetical protein